jgi:hypothetical protein
MDSMSNPGLENPGNACFLNAIVQLIMPIARDINVTAQSPIVSRRLKELLNLMSLTPESTAISPQSLVDTIYDTASQWVLSPYNARAGVQQCAEEFLQYLLIVVPELAPLASFSERTQPHTTWQAGSTKLSVGLVHTDGWPNLSLGALIHAQYAGAERPVEIGQMNDVLIVHIKRWCNHGGNISKDHTQFSMSEPLEIYDCSNVCIARYGLSGFVEHHGRSAKSGHYTTTSKRAMPDGSTAWLYFDDAKAPARRDEANVSLGGRAAYILLFKRIDGGGRPMPEDFAHEVDNTKKAMRDAEADAERDAVTVDVLKKAHELLKSINICALRSKLNEHLFADMRSIYVQQLSDDTRCTHAAAEHAIEMAMDNPPPFQTDTLTAPVQADFPLQHELPMWSNRAQWKFNPEINRMEGGANLVHKLVYAIVVKHEIYRDLLSVLLDDTDSTVFIERPEQSGKTFTCTLMAWLSNICLGQAAYVLLRSGSQASEDYGKYGESVDALNRMIWLVMLGYTFDGPNGTGPYRKVPEWYDRRLVKADLPSDSTRFGFMNPFVLHSYDLRHDKTLSSSDARAVLNGRWPLVFSRLCTPSNVQRGIVHEMETMIKAYGVDEHGFANLTLLNDECQQNVKEGSRMQEEMHRPLSQNDALFRVNAAAIQESSEKRMSEDEAEAEMNQRFTLWQAGDGYAPPSPNGHGGGARFEAARAEFEGLQTVVGSLDGTMLDANALHVPEREYSRWERSGFSACLKSIVRISATILSSQVSSEESDLRTGKVIALKVASNYHGHNTSTGMDQNNALRIEWRGSSHLEFLEDGDYPTLPSPPRIQKFVMDETFAELARNGYAHILLQVLGVNNGALLNIARFLIAYADENLEELAEPRPVIAITAYMHTSAGDYPGGPWLVFSQNAMPLRNVIAHIAQQMFVDADPKSPAPVPAGKIAIRNGSEYANGIRTLLHQHASDTSVNNALQLPKHNSMFLKNVLALLDGAIEHLAWDKANIKLITVGANLLKVGMTPKTPDHKMSVTLGLLSASSRQLNNLTGEEISQGLPGRTSGSRDSEHDPYWAARGDDLPPRLVAHGIVKDLLLTYKKLQQFGKAAATGRAEGQSLVSAMEDLDFTGFSDLPRDTKLWTGQTPGLRRRRGEDSKVLMVVDAAKVNSTGVRAWKQARIEGCLDAGAETQARIAKFDYLKEDYPDLWETSYPLLAMPGLWAKIYFKWRPDYPHYQATVIDADVIDDEGGGSRLTYKLRLETDENGGEVTEDKDRLVMDKIFLDSDMTEWSYDQPAPLTLM